MSSSADIGESTGRKVPEFVPTAWKVRVHGHNYSELSKFVTRFIGNATFEVSARPDAGDAHMFVFRARDDTKLTPELRRLALNFFHRDGSEARVFEYLPIEKCLRARAQDYFLNDDRLHT